VRHFWGRTSTLEKKAFAAEVSVPNVSVELNFFYMHYNDAKKFAEWASAHDGGKVHPSIYVRHAIMSVVFASEALINRVLAEFGRAPGLSEVLDKASILDKWYLAPFLFAANVTPIPFDRGTDPFQSFKELVQIRNWLAHPKVDNFFDAELDLKSTISVGVSNEEYPWLEMLKGKAWSQTKIPKNPFELDCTHAQSALRILDSMISALRSSLHGQMHEGWLDLITVKDFAGLHNYKAPVYTIWGGYGGTRS
jgi:hypothetical protein